MLPLPWLDPQVRPHSPPPPSSSMLRPSRQLTETARSERRSLAWDHYRAGRFHSSPTKLSGGNDNPNAGAPWLGRGSTRTSASLTHNSLSPFAADRLCSDFANLRRQEWLSP